MLPRECWDIPEGEEIKIEQMKLGEFQDKDDRRIPRAYNRDNEIHAIKNNLEKGVKEMKGLAEGLCQGQDERLWYQGKIWIPNNERLKTSLIRDRKSVV